jgi:hypothetical protein
MKKFYSLFFALLFSIASMAQSIIHPSLAKNTNVRFSVQKAENPEGPESANNFVPSTSTENDVRMPPPANDNCTGGLAASYTLVPNAGCTAGSVNSSTLESGETYGCITPNPVRSVWYSFVANAATMYVSVRGNGTFYCSINFGLRVYRYTGTCPPPTGNAVGCADDVNLVQTTNGWSDVYSTTNLTGLTIGATYLIQITQVNCVNNAQGFCVEVGNPTTCTSCSNTCGAECYYPSSSPPTATWLYSNCPVYPLRPPMNENDSRTMCFTWTAPNTTVNLQLANDNYCDPSLGNTYSFTWQCYTSSCGSPIASGSYTPTTISGLTVGQNYVLCYTWTTACSWESVVPYIYAASALPIELVSFEAKANQRDIDVLWTTSSEINVSEFVIERTIDGQNFTEIQRVKAAGNSSSIINYKVKDLHPVEGNNYYRLIEIDFDGTVTSGKLVGARFVRNFSGLSIIPNPAQDEIGVSFSAAENQDISLSIIDAKGAVVVSKHIVAYTDGINNVPMNIHALPQGIYTIRLENSSENLNTRFIKQ